MSFKDKMQRLARELGLKTTLGNQSKVMFVLKQREDYSTDLANFTNFTVLTGMYNSSTFVSDMLNDNKIESKVQVVVDNNGIDKEITEYKPTHVFIEGLWVVPEKFDVLKELHPQVKFIVRIHSELPFLAQEGIAIDWIFGYLKRGVLVSGNSPRINQEIRTFASSGLNQDMTSMVPMLTNYYPVPYYVNYTSIPETDIVNIGCFGAMRPLKNHMSQAVASIIFAENIGKKLKFHINAGRIEMNGGNALKNIRALFANSSSHELVEHDWTSHDDFIKLIQQMDICTQVSFTETFNIVSADSVTAGVPIVTSPEIAWAKSPTADPTNTIDIAQKLYYAWDNPEYTLKVNLEGLRAYVESSKNVWINYLNS